MEKEYHSFELRSIDAWRYDGMWEWNASYTLERGLVFHESTLTTRKILKALRNWDFLSPASKGKVSVWSDGDMFEIQNKSTGEPLLALMPTA